MAIKITKVGDGYLAQITPPESRSEWASQSPMSINELRDHANDLGVHPTDFWDAAIEADPSLRL